MRITEQMKEQVKARVSMYDVLGRYGLEPNRRGFIRCPFHGEKTASLCVKPKFFKCFGCGAGGDQFTFVMLMENCKFPQAYEILGGTYDNAPISNSGLSRIIRDDRQKQVRQRRREKLNNEYIETCNKLHYYEKAIAYAPRDSEIYAEALKNYDYLDYKAQCIADELARKDENID